MVNKDIGDRNKGFLLTFGKISKSDNFVTVYWKTTQFIQ